MPVQAITQQQQPTTVKQNTINLSPKDFSQLLDKLKNPKAQSAAPSSEVTAPITPQEVNSSSEGNKSQRPIILQSVNDTRQAIRPEAISSPSINESLLVPDKTSSNIIALGLIDKQNQTVSHLLKANPNYSKDAWNIIFSDVNKSKEFNRIPQGTAVSINTSTNELIWKGEPPKGQPIPILTDIKNENITHDGQIIIGEISKEAPTVSHLLKQNSFYGDFAWKIIFSDINKAKPFSSLTNGKIITIDPKTYELNFADKKDVAGVKPISASAAHALSSFATDYFEQDNDFSKKLADSVKGYIGTPYEKIDCYGLVVRGIKNQGINYSENGGVRERMEKLAIEQGLPLNAYQNGEGLIETSGTKLYGKSYVRISDPKQQSAAAFKEMQAILKEGEILSFSTQSQGHTGVVSRKNNEWTYINSGMIDNQIDSGPISRRVGEEKLQSEIDNWFTLAKEKDESLKVSVGILNKEKLITGNKMVAQNNI